MSPPERHHYGRARSQFGELFLPGRRRPPYPVAVLLHGGFWKAQYGRKQMHPLCADLPRAAGRRGTSSTAGSARVSGGGYPQTLDDVAAAVDHLADLPAHHPQRPATSRCDRADARLSTARSGTPRAATSPRGSPRATPRASRSRPSWRRPASSTCGWRRSSASRDGVVHRLPRRRARGGARALRRRVAGRAAPARRPGAADARRPRRRRAAGDERALRRRRARRRRRRRARRRARTRTTSATSTRRTRCGGR